MGAQKKEVFGPIALTNVLTTNILAPAAAPAGAVGYTATADVLTITHLRIVNKTVAAHNFSLFKGATGANAAGTEVIGIAKVVPANDAIDWYGSLRLEGANGFLVGGADANASLVLTGEGEIGKV